MTVFSHLETLPGKEIKLEVAREGRMALGSGNFCVIINAGSLQSPLLKMLRDLNCNSTIHLLMHSTNH